MSDQTDSWEQATETFLLNDEPCLAMDDRNNNGSFIPVVIKQLEVVLCTVDC